MEGVEEVTEIPQILQGHSAVTVRCLGRPLDHCQIIARCLLDQKITAIFEKILITPLGSWGQPRDRPNNMLSSLCHQAVTIVTKQSLNDFKEHETTARLLSTCSCYVTTA